MLDAILSALLNVVLLAGLPFGGFVLFHKVRHKRGLGEISRRAGLCLGEPRYLIHGAVLALVSVVALQFWAPSAEESTREGSAFKAFAGLGLGPTSIALALLYGVVKTGFSEELLFRGLIAGSLARALPFAWANVIQSLIFLAPHLLVLLIAPGMWVILPLIFAYSLAAGWIRERSGSIAGPWLIHASANVTVALQVAMA